MADCYEGAQKLRHFTNRFKHGHDVLRRYIGHDIMYLLEDKTTAGPESFDLLLDMPAYLVRRASR